VAGRERRAGGGGARAGRRTSSGCDARASRRRATSGPKQAPLAPAMARGAAQRRGAAAPDGRAHRRLRAGASALQERFPQVSQAAWAACRGRLARGGRRTGSRRLVQPVFCVAGPLYVAQLVSGPSLRPWRRADLEGVASPAPAAQAPARPGPRPPPPLSGRPRPWRARGSQRASAVLHALQQQVAGAAEGMGRRRGGLQEAPCGWGVACTAAAPLLIC
jgi:hypothetical protein